MADVQSKPLALSTSSHPLRETIAQLRNHVPLDAASPVNQNGSFEFDRVIKAGLVQKRTQKTKTWKSIYLVLRPNTLYIYKSEKENKLRHTIYLSDLTAVALLKDPKQKRQNLFGLFSPAKNFHLQAPNPEAAREWIDLIRKDARIEEEEEEMFLASPIVRKKSFLSGTFGMLSDHERLGSSSPEPLEPMPILSPGPVRRPSHQDYSGLSGNELASHSDMSDIEGATRLPGTSIESLAVQAPTRPTLGARAGTHASNMLLDRDLDRVVWQGWMWLLRSKRGVKQWKNLWAVLRPRNLILYKDESEYTASFVLSLGLVVNVVDLDPVSRTKNHCMQIITEEKSYRFCAHDEDSLVRCLGAFKSLLAKRRELEQRLAALDRQDGGQEL